MTPLHVVLAVLREVVLIGFHTQRIPYRIKSDRIPVICEGIIVRRAEKERTRSHVAKTTQPIGREREVFGGLCCGAEVVGLDELRSNRHQQSRTVANRAVSFAIQNEEECKKRTSSSLNLILEGVFFGSVES